jgi:glycosyltransferase 2 family protein
VSATGVSRGVKTVLSLALAAVLFGYFLWRAPLGEVGSALERINWWYLLASIVFSLASYTIRSLRWGIILRPVGRPRTGDLIGCTAAGFAANTILPARAGELVRPLLLSARSGLPAAATMASILTERLADLATILMLFTAGSILAADRLTAGALMPLRQAAVLTVLGLLAFITVIILLLRWREGAVDRMVSLLPERFRERGRHFLDHVLDGLSVVHDPRQLIRLLLWGFGVWLGAAVQVEMLARAFSIELGLPGAFILLTVGGLGLAIPTPGGVGGFHAATQFALVRLFGVDVGAATAFALVHHAVCFFPITIAGLAYAAAVGWRLRPVEPPTDPASSPDPGA